MTAQQALAWCWPGPADAVGFGYAPSRCPWWRLRDGAPYGPDGPLDLTDIYELVAFDADRELRWRNSTDYRGAAVVLSEDDTQLPTDGVRDLKTPPTRLGPRSHLLADHVAPAGPGWLRLRAARYRSALVPVDLSPADRLCSSSVLTLTSVEYTDEDEHGNLSVVDRRLTTLTHSTDRPNATRKGAR